MTGPHMRAKRSWGAICIVVVGSAFAGAFCGWFLGTSGLVLGALGGIVVGFGWSFIMTCFVPRKNATRILYVIGGTLLGVLAGAAATIILHLGLQGWPPSYSDLPHGMNLFWLGLYLFGLPAGLAWGLCSSVICLAMSKRPRQTALQPNAQPETQRATD